MKRCSKCGEWKEESDFCKNNTRPNGLGSHCKECHRKYKDDLGKKRERYYKTKPQRKEYILKNKERIYKVHNEWSNRNKTHKVKYEMYYRNSHPEIKAKRWLREQIGMDWRAVPQELIDLKAEQIRLFRAVRDKRMGVQEHED